MHSSPFDYSLLHTFGCMCFVLLPTHEKDKLCPKSSRCIFVGYSPAHKGYKCYDTVIKRLCIAKHVSFLEMSLSIHSYLPHITSPFFSHQSHSLFRPMHLQIHLPIIPI